MAAITNEKGVKREVKKLLDAHDWFWFMPPANGYGKAGIADFIALKNGVFLAIETKFGYNKPTPAQKAFIESVYSQHGLGFGVNEKNIEWLEKWLAAFDRSVAAVQGSAGGDPRQAVDEADGALMLNAVTVLTELFK